MNALRFCWEWVSFAIAGGGVTSNIAKAVLLLLLVAYAVSDDSKLKSFIAVPATDSIPSREVVVGWEPSVGTLVAMVTGTIWFFIALGIMWVRFTNLKICGVQTSNGHRRIVVRNRSGAMVRFGACLESINLESINPSPLPPYPYEGARFQIDGVSPPYLEGDIPPCGSAQVNVCVQNDNSIQLLVARHPPEGSILIPVAAYRIGVNVFPVPPNTGGCSHAFFRIVPRTDGEIDLVPDFEDGWRTMVVALGWFVIGMIPPVLGGMWGILGLAVGSLITVTAISLCSGTDLPKTKRTDPIL